MPKKNAISESTNSTPESAPAMTFESSLKELEQIVARLESGELALEEALSEFERGIQLARQGQQTCNKQNSEFRFCLTTTPNLH